MHTAPHGSFGSRYPCTQYLLVQFEQRRATSLGKEPLQRKHLLRNRLEQELHSRAASFGKDPLQRQHFERYLLEHELHSRATSRGNDPPHEQHFDWRAAACSRLWW